MTNYIASVNPFNLATPPPGFLSHMYAFDSQLVIFPSSKEPVYRLCRRTIGPAAPLTYMKGHPDAAICRKHRLAPVKAILPAPIGHFGPHILNDLASYDIQRAGGGEAAANRLDDLDEKERQAIDADIADEGHALGREAYRQIKMATGQTVFSGVKNPEGAGAYGHREKMLRPKKPRKVFRPRNRFGDSSEGAIFTGR